MFAQWRKQTERAPGPGDWGPGPPLGGLGVCVLSSAERVWGVHGPGSHKVTVSEARSEHFLFPSDSIAAPKAPSVGTSLRA